MNKYYSMNKNSTKLPSHTLPSHGAVCCEEFALPDR